MLCWTSILFSWLTWCWIRQSIPSCDDMNYGKVGMNPNCSFLSYMKLSLPIGNFLLNWGKLHVFPSLIVQTDWSVLDGFFMNRVEVLRKPHSCPKHQVFWLKIQSQVYKKFIYDQLRWFGEECDNTCMLEDIIFVRWNTWPCMNRT